MTPEGETIRLTTDAIRWWGFLAGCVIAYDFRSPALRQVLDHCGRAFLALFLMGAGMGIPVVHRTEITYSDLWWLAWMCAMWFFVAAVGWSYVVSRAASPWIMVGVATGALAVTALASWATGGV